MTRLRATFFISALAISTIISGLGQDVEEPARRFGVIFDGAFDKAEITSPVTGARKTVLAAFYEWDFGVRPFTEASWKERNLDWEVLLPAARAVADKIVSKIEPELVRDSRGVILYATISDKDPFLTSIMLSPAFHEKFRETLGDRLHVVLLDRHRLYLFPATGGELADYGPALVKEFARTRLPVSLEVFLLDADGFRVIGEIDRSGSDD